MRVAVHLTIDGVRETTLEGDGWIFEAGHPMIPDTLEEGDIGFWLENWRYAGIGSPNHKSRVFCPWGSCLFVETVE